ncbi:MAG TPA: glycosyl transferase, partial [Candidatus Dormibacteraeota bacterium]|nr:glycosyl transferase [Candidatus Dormibacteraeota bacterium]
LVAVASSNEAAPIQLATGIPVMAMGGFSGSDAALTIDQLRTYVSSGQLRFIVVDGRGAGAAGSTASSSIASWVTSCSAVSVGGVTTAVYDCSGAG